MVKQKSNGTQTRQTITSLAGRIGLPAMFLDLKIMGLEELAGSTGVSVRNKEFILRCLNHISPEVSEGRLTFYTHKLRRLSEWLQKDFDIVAEEDLRAILTFLSKGNARLDGGKFSQGTLHGYKVTLKRFYRWLEGDDEEYPRKVRWIKSNGDTTRIKEPEQILTPQEVLEMIRHARSPRDKAIVSFLYESGARISEMLSMRLRHVEFTSTIVKATLPVSKTRTRIIPLVSCKKHLAAWINYHPLKDDPEAVLWSSLKGNGSAPLRGQTVGTILKRIAVDSGITKRVYSHLFRACSITHKQSMAWPEQGVKAFHGLSKDSKVMKHYSYLSYTNLEEIQRKMNGLPVTDSAALNRGVKCPQCGKMNPLYKEMCDCGLPTELKAVPSGDPSLESQLEARLEKKMEQFIENRLAHDRQMERFMNALLEKSKRSPVLLKAIGEIGNELQTQKRVPPTRASVTTPT